MKNKFLSYIFILGLSLFLSSCGTPEERATVVQGNDSTKTQTSQTDTLGTTSGSDSNLNSDTSTTGTKVDSPNANQKVSTFNHTPIDTITSKSDKTKH